MVMELELRCSPDFEHRWELLLFSHIYSAIVASIVSLQILIDKIVIRGAKMQ